MGLRLQNTCNFVCKKSPIGRLGRDWTPNLDWQKSRGTTDSEIAELIGHGFVEISIANGHDAFAKVTQAEARIQIGVMWV